ncbi:hypothetical protein PPGU16_84270 (plasmid) [Paraburkholderia largidicola]|uniref:Uncharacterized protein n=1 Tax=Paraburkholderia largidicola TaxID=3014751 RepID=A0A7I8C6F2_9BURK|nr:hypothetical protein PPGU16_84270 [Paraburkholderia sp. PGU16]
MYRHSNALQLVAGRKGGEMIVHRLFLYAAIVASASFFIRRYIKVRASARAAARLDACLAARRRDASERGNRG